MKKIIISLLIIIGIGLFSNTFAEENTNKNTIVITTEKVPGVKCTPVEKNGAVIRDDNGKVKEYSCEVPKGAHGVIGMLGNMIKYLTYIALLSGVMFIVYNGILYSMGGADQSLKDESKKRITATLIGLILLLLSGPILKLIAPWIYI